MSIALLSAVAFAVGRALMLVCLWFWTRRARRPS